MSNSIAARAILLLLAIVGLSSALPKQVPYPYMSIQAAVNAATDGETVWVWKNQGEPTRGRGGVKS